MILRIPLLPTSVCLFFVLTFVTLGIWQMQRLTWKNDLQAQIDAAFTQKSLSDLTEDDFRIADKNSIRRGQKNLWLDVQKSLVMNGRILDGKPAVAVIVPAYSEDLTKFVMVEIGCAVKIDPAAFERKSRVKMTVRGVVRVPQWSFFTPENNFKKGHWWRMDVADFLNYFREPFYTAYVTAENTSGLVKGLEPCIIQRQLSNNHLSYAIFWLSAAAIMVLLWYLRFVRLQKSICNPHTKI